MLKKRAFTMIEMSVVLIIIGILVAGTFKGSSLVKASRLNTARSITASAPVKNIEGLVAWYESSSSDSFKSSEAYDGAQISTWYDISPSSIILQKNKLSRTASNDVIYQVSGINNIPSVKFSGSGNIAVSDFYQGASTKSTVFIVIKPRTMPDGSNIIFLDSGRNDNSYASSAGIAASDAIYLNSGISATTSKSTNAANFSSDRDYILALYFSGSDSKTYLNDVAAITGNSNINPGTNALTGLTLGSNYSGNYGFNGLISEVIVYNRVLQIQDRKDIFKYLATKYKIQVKGF